MPFELRGNCVYKLPNTLVKCHNTHPAAMAHLTALRLNVPEAHYHGDGDERGSATVMLPVPPDVARQIAIADGLPADELHLTLAFLGELDQIDNPDMLLGVIKEWAMMHEPLEGRINALGRFVETNRDGEHAIYLGPDLKDLPRFRQGLIEQLEGMQLAMPSEHGFTPHITLAYIPEDNPFPFETMEPVDVTFDTISVMLADERFDYRLGQKPVVIGESQRAVIGQWLERRTAEQRAGESSAASSDIEFDLRAVRTGTASAARIHMNVDSVAALSRGE